MIKEFNIITATSIHANVLAKIGGDTFYETFRPYNTEEDIIEYIKKAYTIDLIASNLINPNIVYFLCYDKDEVVGYVKLIKGVHLNGLYGGAIELEKIYVKADYFGSGAGYELMQHVIKYSKQNEFETLFLGVWQENKRAVSFYQKVGFKIFDTRQFKLGQRICEDFMMKLNL
ncbi:MAG: GNAT family N-acetyltransferase [Bacteroidia bacterium]|nr:GNAT family N-acetyltransferase [Bacteroidia bacterium]